MSPTGRIDTRFSDPAAEPASWEEAGALLAGAELYWFTSVRPDGRPHTTPMIGLWREDGFVFTTGFREQKAHNLEGNDAVTVTTGSNRWAAGTDVVVEGRAARVTDQAAIEAVAAAYVEKYGEAWRFEVGDGVLSPGEAPAGVFLVRPGKVLVFAKDPHGHTTFRLAQ